LKGNSVHTGQIQHEADFMKLAWALCSCSLDGDWTVSE